MNECTFIYFFDVFSRIIFLIASRAGQPQKLIIAKSQAGLVSPRINFKRLLIVSSVLFFLYIESAKPHAGLVSPRTNKCETVGRAVQPKDQFKNIVPCLVCLCSYSSCCDFCVNCKEGAKHMQANSVGKVA